MSNFFAKPRRNRYKDDEPCTNVSVGPVWGGIHTCDYETQMALLQNRVVAIEHSHPMYGGHVSYGAPPVHRVITPTTMPFSTAMYPGAYIGGYMGGIACTPFGTVIHEQEPTIVHDKDSITINGKKIY